MNRSLAIALVLMGMILVGVFLTWFTMTTSDARQDQADRVMMPHRGPTRWLYRWAWWRAQKMQVRAEVREQMKEKK